MSQLAINNTANSSALKLRLFINHNYQLKQQQLTVSEKLRINKISMLMQLTLQQ